MVRRRRRGAGSAKHLSLSATDADWAPVRARAAERGLSIARYVVGLVEADAAREQAGPAPADTAAESHDALVETLRALAARLDGEAGGVGSVESMRRGVAALLDAWALGRVRAGEGDAVSAVLASRMGDESARRFLARIEALEVPAPSATARGSRRRDDAQGPGPDQGALFR